MLTDSDLAEQCRAVARCLTYNEGDHEARAKHTLRECAVRLDAWEREPIRRAWRVMMRKAKRRAARLARKVTLT